MSESLQRRFGTTAEHATFAGDQPWETTVDTTKKTVVVHDGSTFGGFPLAREDQVIRHDVVQDLTAEQQVRARKNLGVDLLKGFRNKLINGDQYFSSRGSSVTHSAANSNVFGFCADRWLAQISSDVAGATQTVQYTKQLFTPGQSEVPGNPRYFSRYNFSQIAAATTVGLLRVAQSIEGVATLNGNKVTFDAYVRSDAPRTGAVVLERSFGTGGSPSASDKVIPNEGYLITIGSEWTRITKTFDLPTVAGKTIGTNINDFLRINIVFAQRGGDFISGAGDIGSWTAGILDVAHCSLVDGDARAEGDSFEYRPLALEQLLSQRYVQKIVVGHRDDFYNTLQRWMVGNLATPMRSTPTVQNLVATALVNMASYYLNAQGEDGFNWGFTTSGSGGGSIVINAILDAELL